MQIKGKYSWMKHVDFMLVDLIALVLAFLISYRMKFGGAFWSSPEWIRYILLVSALNVLISFFVNPYSGILRRPFYMEILRAGQMAAYNLAITSVLFYSFKIGDAYSRVLSYTMFGFYFIFSLLMKYTWKKLLVSGKIVVMTTKHIPLFVIGEAERIEKTLKDVSAGDFQLYDIRGVHLIDGGRAGAQLPDGIPLIGADFEQYILDNNIGDVLVAVSPGSVSRQVYKRLNANGVGLHLVVEEAVGFQPEDQFIQSFGVYKTVSVSAFSFTPRQMLYLGVKRVIDILCGLVGIILLIPLSAIVKLAYVLSGDKAKIFYRQDRIGQNGRQIRIWKYRTMVPDAERILEELLKNPGNREEWERKQKLDNDPRITKVGRILRRTSLDELPQFINLLEGSMSLVGPRPLVAGELESHGGLKLYEKVKPGITGWWGCNGRSNIDYRERLELEYYYVRNCGFYLDLLCIARTVFAVLKKDGVQ